jgi:enoyl-CoA hydratase/carnithine racemase
VEALARRLLALDRAVVAAAKEAVWRGMDLPLPQALELEARLAASLKQRRRRR